MAYKKKSVPKDVQNAKKRVDGMKSIDPALDLGDGVSVAALDRAIAGVTDKISAYNTKLSEIDQMDNEIKADIKALNTLSSRALKGGEFKYGRDSSEYEMMGGKRRSERRKPLRKNGESGNG
jgi:hypothetical protein